MCEFCIRTAEEKCSIQLVIAYADKNGITYVTCCLSCNQSDVMSIIFFFYIRMVYSIVVTGLVCSAILKKLSKKANNVKDQVLSNDLEEHSKYGRFSYIPILLKVVVLLINEIKFLLNCNFE